MDRSMTQSARYASPMPKPREPFDHCAAAISIIRDFVEPHGVNSGVLLSHRIRDAAAASDKLTNRIVTAVLADTICPFRVKRGD